MFSSVKGLLLLILIASFSSVSFSAGSKSSGDSKVGPSVGAMMLFGTGKMGNDTDVLSRSMVYTPVILFAGFNLKSFRIGINYEYDLLCQSDDPAQFSNQNIGRFQDVTPYPPNRSVFVSLSANF